MIIAKNNLDGSVVIWNAGKVKSESDLKEDERILVGLTKVPPTEDQLQYCTQAYQDTFNSNQYQRDRVSGTKENPICYASLKDQEDMKYWDLKNGTNTWETHIDEVKAAHEKPTG
ncbi:hypothetical protein KAR91_87265 [Candidatus Pacearchaeota archaeon]|nr:hypothetical protein [Candidatus Pacearchaeota archaeon]